MWKKLAAAGAVAATVVGAGGVAMAATGAGGSTAGSGKATSGSAAGKQAKHDPLRHALHASWVTGGKHHSVVTHDAIRGQVTAASATSVTLKSRDGFTQTYAVNSHTVVRGKDKTAKVTVKVGDRAVAVGTGAGSKVTATHIRDHGPAKKPAGH